MTKRQQLQYGRPSWVFDHLLSLCSWLLQILMAALLIHRPCVSVSKIRRTGWWCICKCGCVYCCFFKTEEEKEGEEVQKDENQDEDGDKSKPVASQLIPGTSWCVVWTGDGKMFFFNPTTRLSIWEKPNELEDNDKVDEIVSKGPPKKQPSTELSMWLY